MFRSNTLHLIAIFCAILCSSSVLTNVISEIPKHNEADVANGSTEDNDPMPSAKIGAARLPYYRKQHSHRSFVKPTGKPLVLESVSNETKIEPQHLRSRGFQIKRGRLFGNRGPSKKYPGSQQRDPETTLAKLQERVPEMTEEQKTKPKETSLDEKTPVERPIAPPKDDDDDVSKMAGDEPPRIEQKSPLIEPPLARLNDDNVSKKVADEPPRNELSETSKSVDGKDSNEGSVEDEAAKKSKWIHHLHGIKFFRRQALMHVHGNGNGNDTAESIQIETKKNEVEDGNAKFEETRVKFGNSPGNASRIESDAEAHDDKKNDNDNSRSVVGNLLKFHGRRRRNVQNYRH